MVYTATDKHGHFIKDHERDDIRILDDTKQVTGFGLQQPDRSAAAGRATGRRQQLVRDRFKFEQEAAIEFLNQIVRPNYDKAF